MDLSKKTFVSSHKTQQTFMFMPTIFLFLFSHPQKHTDTTSVMDAKQWALTLLLFLLFEPFVFDSLRTT